MSKAKKIVMKQPKRTQASHCSPAELLRAARAAAKASYSPYSNFRVGAAVLAGGKVYTGTNIENASYGLTMCAERAAIFTAVSDGNRSVDSIAVSCIDAANLGQPNSRFLCGACRQVLAEFAAPDATVLIDGWGETSVGNLLPLPFNLK
jgi:cytidine deaminase